MPHMLSGVEIVVRVDRHVVMVVDHEADESWRLTREWFDAGSSSVMFHSSEDIATACLAFESWDMQAPAMNAGDWPLQAQVELYLPSGNLAVDQMTMGAISNVFSVGDSGRFDVRILWRPVGWTADYDADEPQAYGVLQFWPHTPK